MKSALPWSSVAFFCDVDGTLAALQERADMAFIPSSIIILLQKLQFRGVSLAFVSGRGLDDLKYMISPLQCALAGAHGAECRDESGRLLGERGKPIPPQMEEQLSCLAYGFPGVWVENKAHTVAVHYRQNPEAAISLGRRVTSLAASYPGWTVEEGKCVYELKPLYINKGLAIETLMKIPAFTGRYPVFLGDDACDEAGFATVNALGGMSIKVGEGLTQARHRLKDVLAVWEWMRGSLSRSSFQPDTRGRISECRV